MSFFTLLLLSFALSDLGWWVQAHRRLRSRLWRFVAAAFALLMLGGLALIIGGRWLGLAWSEALPRPVLSAIYLWHLLILPGWLVLAVTSSLAQGARRMILPPQAAGAPGVTRREFLGTTATFAPAAFVLGGAVGAESQLERFQIRRLEVPLASLPPALEGLTLAHVTDVHVGRFTRAPVLERIVAQTNALEADLVLLTGDLINYSLRDLPAAIDLVRGLRGRHGVFLCEGNHDLFDDPAAFWRGLDRAGLGFLRGEAQTLSVRGTRLQIFGLPWTHRDEAHREALRQARPKLAADTFPILLGHHPHIFDHAEGFPLTLAGHTHGGQLMLTRNLGGGPALFRYWSGLYQRAGRALAVANGVGNWFPLRLGAPAEILHLTLRKG
jgi:predicted MPP superfamily phosphohydrolase